MPEFSSVISKQNLSKSFLNKWAAFKVSSQHELMKLETTKKALHLDEVMDSDLNLQRLIKTVSNVASYRLENIYRIKGLISA